MDDITAHLAKCHLSKERISEKANFAESRIVLSG
jgi:hypothetical protein